MPSRFSQRDSPYKQPQNQPTNTIMNPSTWVKITIKGAEKEEILQNAKVQNSVKQNAKGWNCTTKTGVWGAGKGQFNGYDRATLLGLKGEQGVGQYLKLARDVKFTANPAKFDLSHPINGKLIEVKTGNPKYATGLLQAQKLDKHGQMNWITHAKYPSEKGLFAEYYVFCVADDSFDNWDIDICGWITKAEILEKYSDLRPGFRLNENGEPEWLNYQIPFRALHPISLLNEGITEPSKEPSNTGDLN